MDVILTGENLISLNSRQSQFLASYKHTGNSTESAIAAGYSQKTAATIGCRLLRHPQIKAELEQWRAKKSAEMSKCDFVDLALKDYGQLDVTEPNKPRFLEIAGKVMGHLGSERDSRPSQTLNLTQITITGAEPQPQLWEMARKLLEGGQ